MKMKIIGKHRFNRLKRKQGATLVEMIIYASLLTIILGLTANFFYQTANFRVNNRIEAGLFQNSFIGMNKMSGDIRKAETVVTPIDENFTETLVIQAGGEEISYGVNGGVLERNGMKITGDEVEVIEIGFRRIGETVQIRLKLEAKQRPFGQEKKEKEYQTAVAF